MSELFPPKTENKLSKLEIIKFNQTINIKKALTTSLKLLVIKRILDVIQRDGRINRTNLAGKTGLNYVSCSRYVNTLVLFGWLRIQSDCNHIAITERGIEIRRVLEFSNEK